VLGGLAYAPIDRLEAVLDGRGGGGGVEVAGERYAYGETARGGGRGAFIGTLFCGVGRLAPYGAPCADAWSVDDMDVGGGGEPVCDAGGWYPTLAGGAGTC